MIKPKELFLCCWLKSIGHPLDLVTIDGNGHDWYAWNFTNSSLQILVISGNNVAFVLCYSIHYAVISISSFVHAR